jgi:hypothetical protein
VLLDFWQRQKEVNPHEGRHPSQLSADHHYVRLRQRDRDWLDEEGHQGVCSKCHPFYTGKQKMVDTGGRVSRFNKKFGLG